MQTSTHPQLPAPTTISLADAALRLGIPLATARGWIKRGVLPSIRIGGRRLVRVSDLDRLIAGPSTS